MPTKSTKKPAVKKTVSKKTVKAAAKKEEIKVKAAPEMAQCKCGGHHCNCGPDCKCVHRGSKCARFMFKLIIILIIFALGFASAKFIDGKPCFRGPRVEFNNGCLDVSSIKCPKMQDVLPMMDIDHNGCITHEEYFAIKKELGRQLHNGEGSMHRGMRN